MLSIIHYPMLATIVMIDPSDRVVQVIFPDDLAFREENLKEAE